MTGKISRLANMAFVGRIMTPGSDHVSVLLRCRYCLRLIDDSIDFFQSIQTDFESVRVFRARQFSFTPISALEADYEVSVAQEPNENSAKPPLLGSWNVDGEIMRQTDETFHFRFVWLNDDIMNIQKI